MPTRKRVKSKTPSVTGGGGGGPTPGGTVAIGPQFGGNDGDEFKVRVALAASYNVQNMIATHDTYLDQGSPNSNFGTATGLLCKQTVPAANNAQRGYIAWDFSGWSNGTVTSATIDIRLVTSALLGENASLEIYTSPTQPIDESTATWNNTETPAGTLRQTQVYALTTTPSNHTITLNSAVRSNMIGNWLYIRCIGTDALGVNVITMTSKEAASNKPTLNATVTVAV